MEELTADSLKKWLEKEIEQWITADKKEAKKSWRFTCEAITHLGEANKQSLHSKLVALSAKALKALSKCGYIVIPEFRFLLEEGLETTNRNGQPRTEWQKRVDLAFFDKDKSGKLLGFCEVVTMDMLMDTLFTREEKNELELHFESEKRQKEFEGDKRKVTEADKIFNALCRTNLDAVCQTNLDYFILITVMPATPKRRRRDGVVYPGWVGFREFVGERSVKEAFGDRLLKFCENIKESANKVIWVIISNDPKDPKKLLIESGSP